MKISKPIISKSDAHLNAMSGTKPIDPAIEAIFASRLSLLLPDMDKVTRSTTEAAARHNKPRITMPIVR
jgi:hypothetical protein